MHKITLRQCSYFLAVAKAGGVAAAADTIGVSQPAIAQAIRKLEDLSGLVLFRRQHAKGMELTAQGKAFLGHAERLLAQSEQLEQAMVEIAEHRSGTIRLGCFQSIAPFCLARIVKGYRAVAPGIVLDVREMLQEDLTNALLNGDLDLAIMYDLGLDPTRIAWRGLASAPPYLIVPEGHALADCGSVSIRSIAEEDFILFDAPQSRDYFFAMFAEHGVAPQITMRASSIESVRSSVAHGLGVSLLSMRPASDVTYDGLRVVPVALEEDLPPTPIVMAHRADREPGLMDVPFMRFCEEVFAAE